METQINQFQRRLLRCMINVKWPQKISTEELHKKLKFEDWNKEISIRRLTWCGHLLRLPPNCPAQIALKLLEEPTRSTRSNKPTWLQIIKKQLSNINIKFFLFFVFFAIYLTLTRNIITTVAHYKFRNKYIKLIKVNNNKTKIYI